MPAYAHRDIVDEDRVGVYHCIARCVRRAFLCGTDRYSGRDFSHRKDWVRDRLRQLAGLFGVEVCDYAVMSNHLHIVLRNRPDLAGQWSDDEVALRCRKIFPHRDELTGDLREPNHHDVAVLTADGNRLATLRSRLASLSWFMRCLCEWVARKANHEDESPGRFWAGRFKSLALLDESAILACSVYVDLNPVRAGFAATPEESPFTSGFDRIRSLAETSAASQSSHDGAALDTSEPPDAWLCELTLRETGVVAVAAHPDGPQPSQSGSTPEPGPTDIGLHKAESRSATPPPATESRLAGSRRDQDGACVREHRIKGFCRSRPESTSCCSIGPAVRSARTSVGRFPTIWLPCWTGWGSIDPTG